MDRLQRHHAQKLDVIRRTFVGKLCYKAIGNIRFKACLIGSQEFNRGNLISKRTGDQWCLLLVKKELTGFTRLCVIRIIRGIGITAHPMCQFGIVTVIQMKGVQELHAKHIAKAGDEYQGKKSRYVFSFRQCFLRLHCKCIVNAAQLQVKNSIHHDRG